MAKGTCSIGTAFPLSNVYSGMLLYKAAGGEETGRGDVFFVAMSPDSRNTRVTKTVADGEDCFLHVTMLTVDGQESEADFTYIRLLYFGCWTNDDITQQRAGLLQCDGKMPTVVCPAVYSCLRLR